MAEEGADAKPLAESNEDVKSEEAPVQDSSSNVEITEESAPAASEGNKNSVEDQQPKPIVEEPNANTVPQLNVIPEGSPPSENTVITEITANETQELPPTSKPEPTTEPSKPKKDVLDAAMESVKTKPVPTKEPRTTIIREPGAPDLPPAANTIFILDLMKQKQEKLRRKKKDDMILEMALKMKKEKEEAKRKGGSSYSYNSGGFLGVHKLTSNKEGKSPQLHRKAVVDEFVAVPSTGESRAMFENQ